MRNRSNSRKDAPMSADAYAGFLKLWLNPSSRLPRPSADVDAYIRYVNGREPLPEEILNRIAPSEDRAA
jgi:hypothetical protein